MISVQCRIERFHLKVCPVVDIVVVVVRTTNKGSVEHLVVLIIQTVIRMTVIMMTVIRMTVVTIMIIIIW